MPQLLPFQSARQKLGVSAALLVVAASLAACGDKTAEGSTAAASGSAAASGTKACPEGYPYCVTLPEGWSLGKTMTGGTWKNTPVMDENKKPMATLYVNSADEYNGLVLGTKGFFDKGKDPQTEPLADGKGVYYEWTFDDPERKGRDHVIDAFVKTDKDTWHCAAQMDKNAITPAPGKLCKSMVAP